MNLRPALVTLALLLTIRARCGADEAADARIDALEREVRRLRSVEQSISRQRSGTVAELENIARAIAIADRELDILHAKLARSEVEAKRLQAELDRAGRGRDSERAALRQVLRAARERRMPSELAVLLQGSGEQSFERGLLQLERLSASEVAAVSRYQREEARIREARVRLDRERAEHGSLEAALAKRRAEAEATHSDKTRALSSLDGRTAEVSDELRQAAQRLRQLVGSLGSNGALRGSEPISTGFDSRRGRLAWPVNGPIRRRFGLERHPRLNTLIEYQGIEIAAPSGTSVRAVHPGRVAYADLFAAYGLLVILDHGDGYYSLYANLAFAAVSAGQSVEVGAVLGTLADATALGGAGLRFELHKGAQAFNPEPWLSRP